MVDGVAQAEKLLDRGIHPVRIGEGFDRACQAAVKHLETIADAIEFSKSNTEVRSLVHLFVRLVDLRGHGTAFSRRIMMVGLGGIEEGRQEISCRRRDTFQTLFLSLVRPIVMPPKENHPSIYCMIVTFSGEAVQNRGRSEPEGSVSCRTSTVLDMTL